MVAKLRIKATHKTLKALFRDLYYTKITIDEAELKQGEFNAVFCVLSNYSPRDQKYIEAKNNAFK